MVEFDLEPDDELPHPPVEGARPSAPANVPEPPHARRRPRLSTRARRRVVAGAAALAVGLASAGAATWSYRSGVDLRLSEQLAVAPGGASGLAHAPLADWSASVDRPRPVAVMDGLVVVEEHPDSIDGKGITMEAVDPTSGRVRWTAVVPEGSYCGTVAGAATAVGPQVGTTDAVVCLTGTSQDGVAVVRPDGRVTTRRIDGRVSTGLYLPVPGGRLLRVEAVGTAPRYPALKPDTLPPTLDGPLVTRDLQVRLEDASTGGTVWDIVVPGAHVPAGTVVWDPQQCVAQPDGNAPERIEPDGTWMSDVGASIAWLSTCGTDVSIDLATGAILQQRSQFDPGYQPWLRPVQSLDGGGYTVEDPQRGGTYTVTLDPGGGWSTTWDAPSAEPTTHVYRRDGSTVGTVEGSVAQPWATDGSPGDLLFTTRKAGVSAYSVDDATRQWTAGASGDVLLLRSAGVVLLGTTAGVRAVDARTGAQRWDDPIWNIASMTSSGIQLGLGGLVGVFTDGRRVVLVEATSDGGLSPQNAADRRWTALDLATGRTDWVATVGGSVPQSIAGRLVRFDDHAVVGLG